MYNITMKNRKKRLSDLIIDRRISTFSLLFQGIVFSVLGIYVLSSSKSLQIVPYIVNIALMLNALNALVLFFAGKNPLRQILDLSVNTVMFLLVLFNPSYLRSVFGTALGLYLIVLAFVSSVSAYFYRKNGMKGAARSVFISAAETVIGVFAIVYPSAAADRFRIIAGIYLLFFAVSAFADFTAQILPQSAKNKVRRRMRVTLPNIFSAFIPVRIYKELKADGLLGENIVEGNTDDVGLEVFIHASDVFPGQMGHLDFCIGNEVMSYGNYDESSYYLWGIAGDGVLEIAEKESYLNFCIEFSSKAVIGFGIVLTEKQKADISAKLAEIMSEAVPWEPKAAREDRHALSSSGELSDYASELYKAANAKFYKFASGKYKTYFGFGSNCAKLGDDVLGVLGIDELSPFGMITPGKYYTYFNREYRKVNSNVVMRRIYAGNSEAGTE